MNESVNRRFDIGVALVLIVIAGVAIWQASALPPGTFEPLGSARVPQATAGLIVLLGLWVIVRAMLREDQDHAQAGARWRDAAMVALLTVFYVIAMQFRLASFAVLTAVFLTAAIFVLARFDVGKLPVIVLLAALTGFGCQYIFTRVFVIDLPGL
jgi:hypothetical protein